MSDNYNYTTNQFFYARCSKKLTSDFSHLAAMSAGDVISFLGTTNKWVSRLTSVLPIKQTTKNQQKFCTITYDRNDAEHSLR